MGFLLAVVAAFSFGDVELRCARPDGWRMSLTREVEPDGAEVAKIALDAPAPSHPPRFDVRFMVPQEDIAYAWDVNGNDFKLHPNWAACQASELAQNMPLYVFFNGNDTSRFSVAASEASRLLRFSGGIREEGSLLACVLTYFDGVEAPISHYETKVRIEARPRPFPDAVRGAAAWIERTGGYAPCVPPEAAFDPLYSSWYNFHQDVSDRAIEAECAIAADMGMKTLIVDDGWQTDDSNRGYAYCGDWKVSSRRFPDMAAHVKKVQAMGMKYMMWYSVPFVGFKSANFARFKGKYLHEDRGLGASVLDPRFPEVRKFLVDTYVQALRDWNVDGFKLDFIDSFRCRGADPARAEKYAGRDIESIPHAVDRLMEEVRSALVAIRPDVLIEFRQTYVGPAIRKYGNMLRVGDCPGDMRRNRVAISNLRLASGGTSVHADMLEWNFREAPERSALFVLNAIFGVVQYSVMLRDAPEAHKAMLRHWIRFSQEHRDALLKGRFLPRHPELQYPLIEAESASERIIGVYDDGRLVDCGAADRATYVLNATGAKGLSLRLASEAEVEAYDTYGRRVAGRRVPAGLAEVGCPEAGYLALRYAVSAD